MSFTRFAAAVLAGTMILMGSLQTPVAAQKAPQPAGQLKIENPLSTTPIYAVDFGVDATFSFGSGGGIGTSTVNPVTVNRNVDALSVDLLNWAATGRILSKVEVTVFKPGSSTVDATYVLTEAVITLVKRGQGSETVEISSAQVELTTGGKTFCYNQVTRSTACP
jgi:hypothetical protein